MRIPIVNEQDEIIRYKDRKDRNFVDITRTAALWVNDEEGNILIAQRGLKMKNSPGLWGPAVAGTVEEGETYESNIIKEAEEEIGLKNIKPILGPKFYRKTFHKFFAQYFIIEIPKNTKLQIQKNEVEAIKWVTRVELINLLKEKPETFLKNFRETIDNLIA